MVPVLGGWCGAKATSVGHHGLVLDDVERHVLADHADGAVLCAEGLCAGGKALAERLEAVLDELLERRVWELVDVPLDVRACALRPVADCLPLELEEVA